MEFHGWHIHNDLMLRKLFKALSQNSKLGKELKDSSTITSPSPLPCQVRVLGKNQKQKQKQSSTTLTQSKTSFFFFFLRYTNGLGENFQIIMGFQSYVGNLTSIFNKCLLISTCIQGTKQDIRFPSLTTYEGLISLTKGQRNAPKA